MLGFDALSVLPLSSLGADSVPLKKPFAGGPRITMRELGLRTCGAVSAPGGGGGTDPDPDPDTTPGGAIDVLMTDGGLGLLADDGTTFLTAD
jgi:hypothetical protein